jgi:site-specific recombinase XerD
MAAPQSRFWQPEEMDAGCLQPEISSFRLHLAAGGKAARTVRTYTEAVQWFAGRLLRETGNAGWAEVRKQDVQEWMVWLLGRYSPAYASNQFRALQQFFKWLAAEEEIPDPMAGLRPPRVADQPVPVFAGEELPRLERACAGRSFQQRRDAAVIAVFAATGIRLSELAAIGTTWTTRGAAIWICGTGRSLSAARAARPGPSRSATVPPARWTGTSGYGSGTPRRTGRSCGSGRTTAAR